MKHHQQQPPSHLWNPSHAERNKPCLLPRNWKPITNMPGNTTTTTTTTTIVQSQKKQPLPKRQTRTQRQPPPRNHPSPAILRRNPPKNAKAVVAKDDEENWSNPLVPQPSVTMMTTIIFHAHCGLPESRPCNRNNSPCGISAMMPRANSPRAIRIGP